LLLFASLAVALFFLAYPLYVIRPFRQQGARELKAALFVLHWQHIVEIACAAAAFFALFLLLRPNPTTGSRIRTIASASLVLLCAALSFVNIFEVMFHPAGAPAFQPARASRLDGDEKVLTVNAHAYPIRIISYHHIVNDTEDGVPIAVTY
jgi:hypothetical protein